MQIKDEMKKAILRKEGKEMKKIFLVLMLTLVVFARLASAGIDMNATYVSQYIWRGFDLGSPAANNAAIQPGISISEDGYTLGIWGSFTLGSPKGFSELDAYVDYSASLRDGLDYSVGYTYYTFPVPQTAGASTSGELYGGLSWTNIMFSPNLTVYYDHVVGGGNGLYTSLSGGYDFDMISSSLALGYNAGQWGAKSGSTDIALGLSSEIAVGEVTVTPSVNYVLISDTSVNPNSSEFWFGIDIAGSI